MLLALREFTYLTVPSAPTYRAIMQALYQASLMQQRSVSPEVLLSHVRESINDLTDDALQQHVNALVEWGNVGERRDTSRVETLSQYVRRRNLYFATSHGLAIERFLVEGLDAAEETAAVGPRIITQMETQWVEIQSLLANQQDEELEEIWTSFFRNFKSLSEDVRALTVSLERQLTLSDLDTFTQYKEALNTYVDRLAAELAGPGRRLRDAVASYNDHQDLMAALVRVRAGRVTRSATVVPAAQAHEAAVREWQSLHGWLVRPAAQGDGLEYGIAALRGAISQAVAFVDAVRRTRELGLGRASELADLATQLSTLPTANLAREQLSQFFGTAAPMHLPGGDTNSDPIQSWLEAVEPLTISAVRKGRQKTAVVTPLPEISTAAKAELQKSFKAQQKREQRLLELFQGDGALDLNGLAIPDDLMPAILQWVSDGFRAAQEQASGMSDGVASTSGPMGRQASVTLTEQPATIHLQSGRSVHIERGARVVLT